MQQTYTLKVRPAEAEDDGVLKKLLAAAAGVPPLQLTGFVIVKKSLDARGKQPWVQLSLRAFINEPFQKPEAAMPPLPDVSKAKHTVVVVGAGPAGLFAALRLAALGIRPIVIERGKDVRARRRDLATMNKEGLVNAESNYCFGEGGAGTYSDGKLYTRSTKRGNVQRILQILVHAGAHESILYDAHPHIGTNKLPHIITALRQQLLACGALVHFEKKLVDLVVKNNTATGVVTADGDVILGDAVILATGHSARDIFTLLQAKNIAIQFKPFALGVRVEHPQALIDAAQYHTSARSPFLPPASYSLVQQVGSHGVFSFCMCPGGIIAPAATSPGEIVVNGWSPSKRNNPYANSGIVVTVDERLTQSFSKAHALAGLLFQQDVEQKAATAGGGALQAPAQRLVDFSMGKTSASLPACSYIPGIVPADLRTVLPAEINTALQTAFIEFGKKIKGYYTNDAVVVATESRTSSPVRIPRDADTLQHPQIKSLYPCAEGAGYAGGIVSAAMDGERVADAIAATF